MNTRVEFSVTAIYSWIVWWNDQLKQCRFWTLMSTSARPCKFGKVVRLCTEVMAESYKKH